jgi:hypothetical protein
LTPVHSLATAALGAPPYRCRTSVLLISVHK